MKTYSFRKFSFQQWLGVAFIVVSVLWAFASVRTLRGREPAPVQAAPTPSSVLPTPIPPIRPEPAQPEPAAPSPIEGPPQPVPVLENGGPAWNFYDLEFPSEAVGLAFGDRVYRSTDRGETWRALPPFATATLLDAAFASPEKGLACGFGGIFETSNGGASWQPSRLQGQVNLYFHSVSWGSPEVAMLAGENGSVFRTEDGGQSWRQVLSYGRDWVFESIQMLSASQAFVSGSYLQRNEGRRNGVIYATMDSGNNWTEVLRVNSRGDDFLNVVRFSDSSRGWSAGMSGEIFGTGDGGTQWNLQLAHPAGAIFDFAPLGSQAALAIGGGGWLYRTTEGTKWTWERRFPADTVLKAVAFPTRERGFVAGDRGAFFQTLDGGMTWTTVVFKGQ